MNSNSGVVFSPPSIVKDTLGDSGMLLDTEITMTNSPDMSPTQVPNVLNKAIMKKMGEQKRNLLRIHQIEQRNIYASKKLTNFVNSHSKNCTVPLKISDENEDFSDVKYVNYKIHHLKVKGTAMQSQLNPYADENDIDNNFQLSKTINATVNPRANTSVMTDILNRPRYFGNDRSNSMHISTRSQNIINLRRENFHTINISNNMIVKNSSTNPSEVHNHNQNPKLTEENTVMFRNYDLNDEYWFNFE